MGTRNGVGLYFLFIPLLVAAAVAVNWVGNEHIATAQSTDPSGTKVANLREQLETGLRARRDVEFQFIARVVKRVEQKQFSVDLVTSVFYWAVRKNKKTPFPHFQWAMLEIAARNNVDI